MCVWGRTRVGKNCSRHESKRNLFKLQQARVISKQTVANTPTRPLKLQDKHGCQRNNNKKRIAKKTKEKQPGARTNNPKHPLGDSIPPKVALKPHNPKFHSERTNMLTKNTKQGPRKQLRYSSTDRERFTNFFEKPEVKPSVGRPRKKKRRYNKNKKKSESTAEKKQTLLQKNGEAKSARRRLKFEEVAEGIAAKDKLQPKPKRINWDRSPHKEIRDQLATDWITKTGLWRPCDSFSKFCKRVGIDRCVLNRYVQKIKKGLDKEGKKRGRKSLLMPSVMRHLCEGKFFCLCFPL